MFILLQNWLALTKKIICNNHGGWDWDIGQWFTPPKSKDPWTAMTKGSTGGWAAPYAKPFAFLPMLGSVLGSAVAGPGVGAAIGSSIGALQGKTTGIWGKPGAGSMVKGGLHGLAQSGVGGAIGSAGAAGGFNAAAGNIGSAFAPATAGSYTGAMDKYGIAANAPTYGPGTGAAPMFSGGAPSVGGMSIPKSGGDIMSMFNPYTAGQEAGSASKGINWGQVAGGAATALAPSMMGGKTPQIPESAMYGDITSRLLGGKGISEIGAMGREKLMGGLNEQFSPVPDEYYNASTRRLDEAYDKAEKDFTTQYQGMRPGADVGGDSAYREGINELRQNRAREKSAIGAELDYRREADYYDRQYQNISTALGVDQQTMQDYMSLAQMDADRIATNTGITMGEATQFKEIFGQLGGYLMQRGLGLNDPTKALQSLMTRFGG